MFSSSGEPVDDATATVPKATRLFGQPDDPDAVMVAPDAPHAADRDDMKVTRRISDAPMRSCPKCATRYTGSEEFCPFDGTPLEAQLDYDPDSDPLIGCNISGRYLIEGVLAQGGMGTVYKVRHSKLESLFAMKVLHRDLAEDPEVAGMLIEEARATATIGHPNIVGVADFGEIDKTVLPELGELKLPFFVMEYLSGPSLSDVLREEGRLSSERVANIMSQVAGALAAAHKMGIIHRDLKPENIRITRDEVGGEIAKVLDFGIAKVMGSSKKTQVGMVFGTPHYMSPEQGQGKPIDHRTDIYAIGVLMYECLTGTVPFAADTFMGVITKHMFERPRSPDDALGAMALEPIMMQCLAKNPDARYASMVELCADLDRAAGGEPTLADMKQPAIKLRDSDRHTGSRLSIPFNEPERRWLWAGLTVVAAGAVAALVIRYAGGDASVTAPLPEPSAATPSARPAATTQPAATAIATEPQLTASAAPSETAPSIAPPAPTGPRPAPVGPRPTPRPQPGGDVVDPWSN
jgi:serine/threonine-protein kinase